MYPKDSGVKKISIGEMMERKEDLKKWIRQSLTDLDAADYQEEMNNVLHDKVLGDTEEQRLLLLQRAKKATMFLNGIAIALSVWCMLYPRPYEILVTSLIMLPLISLGFLHYFRGTIKFYVQRQKSVYPRIATAFLFPLFVLTIKVAMGYNILNWDGFWFPFSCLSIVFYLLTLYVAKDIRHKISWVLALVIMCSIYSYAAIISLNSVLDNSAPYVYKAQLIQKRVSSGRSTTYYFTLSPWALKKEESEIRVRKGVFDRHQNNEDVEVITRFGRFGIPWFFVQ